MSEAITWVALCRRTDDPKLTWIEQQLTALGIPHRRNGQSFHAPILEVPTEALEYAYAFLARPLSDEDTREIDEIDDDDPVFFGEDQDDRSEAIDDNTRPCAHCHGSLDFDYPYAYCETCQETQTCQHGVLYKEDCNACNVLGDFAYDAQRERR